MVRLKVAVGIDQLGNATWFQFLNGAIKRNTRAVFKVYLSLFQFLNGAIKRPAMAQLEIVELHFNSSMVRLKARLIFIAALKANDFNSSMVRLKEVNRRNDKAVHLISIPQWCD